MPNFPASLPDIPRPTPTDSLNSAVVPHAQNHVETADELEAVAVKVGINNSADTTSHDYKLRRIPYNTGASRGAGITGQSQNLTRYLTIEGSLLPETDESLVQKKIRGTGKITFLRATITPVGGSGQTYTLRLRKNGVDTALSLVWNSGEGGEKEITGEVDLLPTDKWSLISITSATSGTVGTTKIDVGGYVNAG